MTGEDIAQALKKAGYGLLSQGKQVEAIAAFRRSLAVMPADAGAFYELGRLTLAVIAPGLSGDFFRRALATNPGLAEVANGLAFWHFRHGRHAEAIAALRKALAISPESAEFRSNIAGALKSNNEADEAAVHARMAIALVPGSADAHNNLGEVYTHLGDAVSAAMSYRRTLSIDSTRLVTHRNLLLSILYDADTSPQALFRENRRFVARFAGRPEREIRFANTPDPERQLTIGYASSDFRYHTVARSILPTFLHRDCDQFRAVGFADVSKPDRMTDEIRRLCDGWHRIDGLSDAAVADLIRQAGVDVLVILAGHFDANRGLLASQHPAPIVVSTYDGTTSASPDTHYLIADRTLVPRHGVELHSERVLRLPVFVPYRVIDGAPEVGPPPALSRGRVTFGSFNSPLKINESTAALWARVLQAVPGSVLVLKHWRSLSYRRTQDRLRALFRANGIEADRLLLDAASDNDEPIGRHLARYAGIDIALDTSPFNGSTTTFEALWMGVPVVTLLGRTTMSRWGASLLERVGHPEWIGTDPDRFVDKAAGMATDLDALARIRRALRAEVSASRLFRDQRVVRNFERLYRAVWRRWCASLRGA